MLDNFYKSDGVSSAGNPTIEMRIVLLLSCFILLASASLSPDPSSVQGYLVALLQGIDTDDHHLCNKLKDLKQISPIVNFNSSVTAMLLSAA